MPRGNPSPKLAITVDPAVHRDIVAAAAHDHAVVVTTALLCRAAILTGDPDDIRRLVRASGREIAIVAV
jgi:hypothetical protein